MLSCLNTCCFHLSRHTRALPVTDTQIDQRCFLFRKEIFQHLSEDGRFFQGRRQSQRWTEAISTCLDYWLGMWVMLRWKFPRIPTYLPFYFPSPPFLPSTLPPFIFRQKSVRQAQEVCENSGQQLCMPPGRVSVWGGEKQAGMGDGLHAGEWIHVSVSSFQPM